MSDEANNERVIFADGIQRLVGDPIKIEDLPKSLAFSERLQEVLTERMDECERVFAEHGWDRTSPKNFPFNAEPFSDLWYAGKIGLEIYMLRLVKDRGFHSLELGRAMRMSELWTDWQWRQAFKREILIGKNKREKSKQWSDARNNRHDLARYEIVRVMDEYLKKYVGASLLSAAAEAKRQLQLAADEESIVKRYRRAKAKP